MFLKNCITTSLEFSLNEVKKNEQFNIKPSFHSDIKIPKENGDLICTLTLTIDNKESETPFNIKVSARGFYKYERGDELSQGFEVEIINPLFMYIRSLVTNVTAHANIPTYTMPMVNFKEFKHIDPNGN